MKTSRKYLIAIISVLAICFLGIGITFAYLEHHADTVTNKFTVGNVSVKLREPEWDKVIESNKILSPNDILPKNPYVENTGGKNVYCFLEVKVPRKTIQTVSETTKNPGDDNVYLKPAVNQDLFSLQYKGNTFDVSNNSIGKQLNPKWTELTKLRTITSNYSLYVFGYNFIVNGKSSTEELFDHIQYKDVVQGQITQDTKLDIEIKTIAIQSDLLPDTSSESDSGDVSKNLVNAYNLYVQQENKDTGSTNPTIR